jgi:hypothetical protein
MGQKHDPRRDDDEQRATDRLEHLFGISEYDAAFLPPSRQVGWMESGPVGGGWIYCLDCVSAQPTAAHIPVYDSSYFATRPCAVCRRRLDTMRP